MKDSNGNWRGIAVDLWRQVANDLGLAFAFEEMAMADLAAGLKNGTLMAVVTVIATAEREAVTDLSFPFYSSGLAIAVPVREGGRSWIEPLGHLLSPGVLKITSLMSGLLFIAALLVWLCERSANPGQFGSRPLAGIADGIWWAVVTLTTVGYGDKAPRSWGGRLVAAIWMLSAVVLIALFTAQVTAAITVNSLTGRVRGPRDLAFVRVGAIEQSQQQAVLRQKLGVIATGFTSFGEGLKALDRGEIDAFVGPEPVIRYEIANNFPARLTMVGTSFLRVDYVVALPLGSTLRKPVNGVILSLLGTDEWQSLLRQYLGVDG
jgi:ABC-type amino acid transport substrate-binding protein